MCSLFLVAPRLPKLGQFGSDCNFLFIIKRSSKEKAVGRVIKSGELANVKKMMMTTMIPLLEILVNKFL